MVGGPAESTARSNKCRHGRLRRCPLLGTTWKGCGSARPARSTISRHQSIGPLLFTYRGGDLAQAVGDRLSDDLGALVVGVEVRLTYSPVASVAFDEEDNCVGEA